MKIKTQISLGVLFLFLAVLFGAFGAHGLSESLSLKQMATFKTGVTYQFYHAIGLILLACLTKVFNIKKTHIVGVLFTVGIILFSFNCYIYAITGVKTFAMIVPLGGISFIIGWLILLWNCLKLDS
jgi:uncharacterized membrane protein YgdD (TMEM256/DUF423 family)